jgi:hypothetical protein
VKKPFKTTLIAIAASVALALIALAIVPLVLKDRVAKLVRSELNERLDAAVDFEAIDLSLLSTFPTLTVEVVDLSIAGKGVFEGTTLLSVQSLGAGVDLFSLIGDDALVVESIAIEHPEIHVVVTEDGVANYDIVKARAEASEELDPEEEADTADIVLQLRRYRIIDGAMTYDAPGTHVLIDGLHHDGSATITGAAQTLASKTTIGELSVKLGRVTYLKKAKVEVAIATTLRTDARHIDLEKLSIAVNELSVAGSGDIGWTDDALDLDVEVASAKGQSLKALVSAVPNAYAADFAGLRASGSFSLDAKVKGQLGPDDDDIPSFSVRLLVHDGTLKYPDLPLPLTNVALDAKATHPGGNLDKMRIDVAKYGARAGESHAAGRLAVTTPISQPDVAVVLEGRFDMAEIAEAYPIPDVEDLRGVITATLDLAAKGDDIKRLKGDIRVTDVVYRAKDAPPVQVEDAHVVLSPQATTVKAFRANLGRSDVALSGSLSPFTAFLSDDETITGNLQLKSQAIYVDDFLSEEGDEQAGQETTPFLLPDHVNAKLAVDVGKLTYGDLVLSNFKGTARVRRRKLTLSGVRADALGGSMKLSGTVATPVGKPATFEMDYEVDKARFAEAFEELPSMRAYAPIARFLDGRFSTNLKASGELGDDGEPKLRSIDADGLVMTLQSKLRADFKPLAVLHDAVPAIPKPLDLSSLRARFNIEDGAVRMKPFEVKTKGLQLLVSGSHGLDQEMSYRVGTDIPIDKVTGALAKKVQGIGLDLSKASDVAVAAKLTGSIQHPRVSVDVDTDALRGAVADTISAELEARRQQALAAVVAQNQKIMAEATKRAAQVRTEGKNAAEMARKEGYKRADQLVAKAGNNTLQQIAAKEGAKQVRRETDKRADQLIQEADKRATQIVAEAKKQTDRLQAEAEAQSERATDAATNKIAN